MAKFRKFQMATPTFLHCKRIYALKNLSDIGTAFVEQKLPVPEDIVLVR